MGVAGAGKTTVGRLLSRRLGWSFYEGDDLHPSANVAKMARGEPLSDEDRWPWLEALRERMSTLAAEGCDAVFACSALKRSYRDYLREVPGKVCFVHLEGPPALIRQRLEERSAHFAPSSLLDSQLATLEPPRSALRITVDASPEELVERILTQLRATDSTVCWTMDSLRKG